MIKRLKAFKNYIIARKKYFFVYLFFIALMLLLELLLNSISEPPKLLEINKESIKDIDLTDIYYNISDWRENDKTQHYTKEVVLINIGDVRNDSLRMVLPTILSHLKKYKAKAIGIDILFEGSRHEDNILINSIKNNKSIVLARIKNEPLFGDKQDLKGIKQGIINFPEANKKTIRNYYNYVITDSTTIYSFANHLVGDSLLLKNNEEETFFLKYSSSEIGYYNYLKEENNKNSKNIDFPAIESSDLLNEKYAQKWDSLFNEKIVIIGQLGDKSMEYNRFDILDKFKVPVSLDLFDRDYTMPGMVIHANAVQMLMNQKNKTGKFHDVHEITLKIILFAILFLYYLVFLGLEKIEDTFVNLLSETAIIIAMTLFFIRVSAQLMVYNYHLRLDLLLILLPVLIEYKMFFHEMLHHHKYEEWLEKYSSQIKKVKKWIKK